MRTRSRRVWRLASHPVIFFVIMAVLGILFEELAREADEKVPSGPS